MKPHKHKDLIIAWANGAQIQVHTWRETFTGREPFWNDVPNNQPDWCPLKEYRIKPREFEVGAFYPAINKYGHKCLIQRTSAEGNPVFRDKHEFCAEPHYHWIGEPLNIDWPEAG